MRARRVPTHFWISETVGSMSASMGTDLSWSPTDLRRSSRSTCTTAETTRFRGRPARDVARGR